MAGADAAPLILNEHLLSAVDGQGGEDLLAGQELFRPPIFTHISVEKSGLSLHPLRRSRSPLRGGERLRTNYRLRYSVGERL